jgi:serine/threonine protein kinase
MAGSVWDALPTDSQPFYFGPGPLPGQHYTGHYNINMLYDNVVAPLQPGLSGEDIRKHQIDQINKMIVFKLDRERKRKNGEDCGPSPDWALMLHKFMNLQPTHKYEKLKFLGDGTYSNVYKVRSQTGELFAMKKIKSPSSSTQVSLTTLREMKVLMMCHHKNLINLVEFVVGSRPCSLGYVLEFGEVDILALIKRLRVPFEVKYAKSLFHQVLEALEYLHQKTVVHRDIKLSNFLLTVDGTLKICDFGLARGLYDENQDLSLTPLVVTLWYRAPELLLGETHYSSSVDVWATGCIFYELITLKPLFPGKTELDELDVIFSKFGTPDDQLWPGFSSLPHCQKFGFVPRQGTDWASSMTGNSTVLQRELVSRCLIYNPARRLTAKEALAHDFFKESPPAEKFILTKDILDTLPNAVHTT